MADPLGGHGCWGPRPRTRPRRLLLAALLHRGRHALGTGARDRARRSRGTSGRAVGGLPRFRGKSVRPRARDRRLTEPPAPESVGCIGVLTSDADDAPVTRSLPAVPAMMLAAHRDGHVVVTQPAHAWLSGQLARAWGNERFGRFEPWEDVCLAAEQHDVGMTAWDLSLIHISE